MASTLVAKQAKAGKSLLAMETQAMNAISQLKQIKINIVALRSLMNSDADYTTEDEAEVQAVFTSLFTEINRI